MKFNYKVKSTQLFIGITGFLLIFSLFFIIKTNIVHSAGGVVTINVATNNCNGGPLGPDEICTSGLYPTGVDNNFHKLPLFSVDQHYLLENVTNNAGYYPCQPGSGTPNHPKFPAPVYREDEYNSQFTYFTGNPSNYSGAVSNGQYAGTELVPYVWNQLSVYPWTGTYIHPYVFTTPKASWIGNDTFGHDYEYYFYYGPWTGTTGPGAYSNLDPDGNGGTIPTIVPSDINNLYSPTVHPNGICFNPSDGEMYNSSGNFNLPNPQTGITFNGITNPNGPGYGPIYATPNNPTSQITESYTGNIPSNTYIYSINNPSFPVGSRNKFYINTGSNVNKSNLTFQIAGQADNVLAIRLNGCYLSAEGNVPINAVGSNIGQQAQPVNKMTWAPTSAYTHYENGGFNNHNYLFDFSLGSCQINTGQVGNTLLFYLKSSYDLTGMIITSMDFTDQLPSTVPISHPYFTVTSGDISAGNQVSTAGACSITANSAIQSWNNNIGSYFGAGAQGAAFASGNISNFISDLKFGGGQPPPSTLTFSNTNTNSISYGGHLTSLPCFDNYYNSLSKSSFVQSIGNNINLSVLNSGIYQATGSVTVMASDSIASGKDITLLVNGSVTIDSNITYGPYSINNIPRINIIASGGNINVASNVTQLHGFYSTNNSFITCYDLLTNSESTNSLVCNNQLTVYGSVFANTINLDRTAGDQIKGTGSAEVFNNSPEFWIPASSTCQIMSNCLSSNYANESTLPPVL